jgi:hypothetical protein
LKAHSVLLFEWFDKLFENGNEVYNQDNDYKGYQAVTYYYSASFNVTTLAIFRESVKVVEGEVDSQAIHSVYSLFFLVLCVVDPALESEDCGVDDQHGLDL